VEPHLLNVAVVWSYNAIIGKIRWRGLKSSANYRHQEQRHTYKHKHSNNLQQNAEGGRDTLNALPARLLRLQGLAVLPARRIPRKYRPVRGQWSKSGHDERALLYSARFYLAKFLPLKTRAPRAASFDTAQGYTSLLSR